MKTAEKAVLWFRNEGYDFNCLVMAHTHRLGSYKIGNTTMYEQGAACETQKMRYGDGALVNSQQQGCIYVCLDKDGYNIESRRSLSPFEERKEDNLNRKELIRLVAKDNSLTLGDSEFCINAVCTLSPSR